MFSKYEQLIDEFEKEYVELCHKHGVVVKYCAVNNKLCYQGLISDEIADNYFDSEIG